METMTPPPKVRTRPGPAAVAPSETTRRRTVPSTRPPVRRPVRRRTSTAPKAPFGLLIVAMLGGGLVSVVLLNTVLAQDAFTLSELQRGNQRLNERKQTLQEDIARESGPQVLRAKARGLGMRDIEHPAFIDPRTGRVIDTGARG
jgi:uncharacterized protein HemX